MSSWLISMVIDIISIHVWPFHFSSLDGAINMQRTVRIFRTFSFTISFLCSNYFIMSRRHTNVYDCRWGQGIPLILAPPPVALWRPHRSMKHCDWLKRYDRCDTDSQSIVTSLVRFISMWGLSSSELWCRLSYSLCHLAPTNDDVWLQKLCFEINEYVV